MYPFQNILFATDFSSNSKSALKYAAAFAREHNATIYLHNAQEASLPPQALKISDRALAENGYEWVMAVKKEMEDLANSELLNGLKVQMILSEGRPAEEIARVIKDYKIDLATIGTTTHTKLGGGVGSTALNLLPHAGCPVLLTRHAMHDFVFYKGSETGMALNRILFATDFSDYMQNAKQLAFELAHRHKAHLTVIHSVSAFVGYLQSLSFTDLSDLEGRVRNDTQDRLTQIATEAGGIEVDTVLSEGRVYEEVVRIATEKDVDLIVIGTGKPRTSALALPGRNAERIIRAAPCPVLAIRHG